MSTQPAFTSGPWTVRHATDVVAMHQPEGSRHVADCDPYHLPIDHPRWEQEAANARLIATAPEGLAFAQVVEERSDSPELRALARAFITKATEGR